LSTALESCVAALAEVDRELATAIGPLRSLAPDRATARSLVEIAQALLVDEDDDALVAAFADGMAAIGRAQAREFPDNLLWDRDALAGSLVAQSRTANAPAHAFARLCETVVELHVAFGVSTEVRFRYVHDFAYGFDWAKWVRRDPAARAGVGPFDASFLAAMRERGGELVRAIRRGDDPKYPPLAGPGARNPFGFSREPEGELALHVHLARAGLIPVEAWRFEPQPRWREPFDEIRRSEAARLGLARDDHAGRAAG
jgi:hypothetical protein